MVDKNHKVDTTQIINYKKECNSSESVALGKTALGCKEQEYIIVDIPEKIDLESILEKHPLNFKYHIDNFLFILSLITSIPARKRDMIKKFNGFTPINKKLLQQQGIRNYRPYINYLKERRIIDEDKHYRVGKKSQVYRFNKRYRSKDVPVRITKKSLLKAIRKSRNSYNKLKTEQLNYLRKWFNGNLEVDLKRGFKYLSKQCLKNIDSKSNKDPFLKFNSQLLPLKRLFRSEYDFYVDKSGERLHTNITQLKSELRGCLTYNGKKLSSVDISNAQPYLSIVLLDSNIFKELEMERFLTNPKIKNNPKQLDKLISLIKEVENEPDVIKFKQMVASGEFYERFGLMIKNSKRSSLNGLKMDRKEIKTIAFETINSPNRLIGIKVEMQLFKEAFPNVYKVFTFIKKGKHAALSTTLQRLEAFLVLHKTCGLISRVKPNIPLYTLHDNIVTTRENLPFVKSILSKVLRKNIGVKPTLKKEHWD